MWDAARDMSERIPEEANPNVRGVSELADRWLEELLYDADEHFEKATFERDGAREQRAEARG